MDVAKLTVVVDSDTQAAEAGLDRLHKHVTSLGGMIGTAFSAGAVAGTVALVGGFGASLAAAADFEKTLSGVKAVSGATGAEMQGLSSLALQLGKDTSFSASAAASGIEELVKGGLTIPDIMGGAAKATLDLAAAGGVALPEAANIAANALAQFNLKGQDMAHVADLIAGAANASALDVGQFKFSLQAAGAVAATVGFHFDDLAVAIAEMGKAGITGSDAGTSLKTMFMNLSPQTDKAKNLMGELGIITATGANQFFDASGKVKSLADVQGVLQGSLSKLTQEQKLNALTTLFGSDAVRAAAVLAKEGAGGFTEMAGAMGKVTAASVGAERLNNFSGSLEQLKGSVETAAITLGTALLPAARGAVDGVTKFVNDLIPLFERIGPGIATALTGAGERLTTFFGSLAGSQTLATAVNKAFGDLIPPGLNAVLDTVDGAFKTLKDTVTGVVSTLQTGGLAGVWESIQKAMADFAPTGERIGSVLGAVKDAVAAMIPQPLADFVTNLTGMATAAAGGTTPMQGLADVVNAVSTALASAVGFVKEHTAAQAALVGVVGSLTAVWALQTAAAGVHAVQLGITAAATAAYTAVQTALDVVLTANPIGLVVVALAGLAAGLVYAYKNSDDFRNVVDTTFATVKATAEKVLPAIGGFLSGVGDVLKTVGDTAIAWKDTVAGAVDAARAAVEDKINAAKLILEGLGTTLGQVADTAGKWKDLLATAFENARAAIEEKLGKAKALIETFATDAVAALTGMIASAGAEAGKIGGAIIDGLASAIRNGRDAVLGALREMAASLPEPVRKVLGIGSPSRVFMEIGQQIVEGLRLGITSSLTSLPTAFAAMTDLFRQAAESVKAPINDLIGYLKQGISTSGYVQEFLKHVNEQTAGKLGDALRGYFDEYLDTLGKMADGAVPAVQRIQEDLAKGLGDAVKNAVQSAQAAVEQATNQIQQAISSLTDSRELRGRRGVFDEGLTTEARARSAQREDTEARYQLEKELARATTDEQRKQIMARFADAEQERAHRRQLAEEDRLFAQQQADQRQAFEDQLADEGLAKQLARIQTERDARIQAIQDELKARQDAAVKTAQTALARIVEDVNTQINDSIGKLFDNLGAEMGKRGGPTDPGFLGRVREEFAALIVPIAGMLQTFLANLGGIPGPDNASVPLGVPQGTAFNPNLMPPAAPAAAPVVVVNVSLPTGAYVGTAAEIARILQPELARLVRA